MPCDASASGQFRMGEITINVLGYAAVRLHLRVFADDESGAGSSGES
jgi:hypothetical protein